MATRRLVTTLSSETKFNSWLYLADIVILLGFGAIGFSTKSMFTSTPLQVMYMIMLLIIGGMSIYHPKGNPFKRNYQVILFAIKKDRKTYHMIEPGTIRYLSDKKEDMTLDENPNAWQL